MHGTGSARLPFSHLEIAHVLPSGLCTPVETRDRVRKPGVTNSRYELFRFSKQAWPIYPLDSIDHWEPATVTR
jgi:hypothetical protein